MGVWRGDALVGFQEVLNWPLVLFPQLLLLTAVKDVANAL